MKHNKLVRDKIPDIILADGKEVSTKILSDKDFKVELEKLDGRYLDDVIVAARQKREKRGGFDKKIFLIEEK